MNLLFNILYYFMIWRVINQLEIFDLTKFEVNLSLQQFNELTWSV